MRFISLHFSSLNFRALLLSPFPKTLSLTIRFVFRLLDLAMESRDLPSSSPSSTANRDASSGTDADDGVFTVTVALAKDAALHFQSGKFAECVEVLNQLLQKKPNDPKVINPLPHGYWSLRVTSVLHEKCSMLPVLLPLVFLFLFFLSLLRWVLVFFTNCYTFGYCFLLFLVRFYCYFLTRWNGEFQFWYLPGTVASKHLQCSFCGYRC